MLIQYLTTTTVTCLMLPFTRSWQALTPVILSAVPILIAFPDLSPALSSHLSVHKLEVQQRSSIMRVPIYRDNGTIEITGRSIIKASHVGRLIHHFDTTIVLSPTPEMDFCTTHEQELLAVLISILEALEFLHKEPQIFHRDIC